MKAIKAHLLATNPERVPVFEKNAATFAKKCVPLLCSLSLSLYPCPSLTFDVCRVLGNFNDYEFFIGESMSPDGMVALLNYRVWFSSPSSLARALAHSIS